MLAAWLFALLRPSAIFGCCHKAVHLGVMQIVEGHVQVCAINSTLPEAQQTICPVAYACAPLPSFAIHKTTLQGNSSSGAPSFGGWSLPD